MTLHQITQFLKRTGMAETRFGRDTIGDPRLVGDMRNGRQLRPSTAAKLRAFIEEYGK